MTPQQLKYRLLTLFSVSGKLWERYKERRSYIKEKKKSLKGLTQLGNAAIPDKIEEIRLFAIMRNESLRLPYFIEYYQNLGVDRFFFVDNNSTDNSAEIVLKEQNAHLFSTSQSYETHWHWMEYLLKEYGRNHWCVVVDIDELFAYPNADKMSLKGLCKFLDAHGSHSINTLLLDIYSGGSVDKIEYGPGENPLHVLPYFDAAYEGLKFMFHDRIKWRHYHFDSFTGGVRDRVFGKSSPPTLLSKIPLFKNLPGTYLSQGMHGITGSSMSTLQGVVFHTKFLQDFISEVKEECERKQHYGGAFYYQQYNKKLEQSAELNFMHPDSQKFRDLQQLTELGIMHTNQAFEQFAENRNEKKETV